MITVAVDRASDARPWIERAQPTHPSLIDEAHVLGELYNMVNVPTVVWINEAGEIVRPNDVAFTTERGGRYAKVSTAAQMELLGRWIRGDLATNSSDEIRSHMKTPTARDQLARAHFGLGLWLHNQDRLEAAAWHFQVAGELAPHDFMIRRGTMRYVGSDPFGEEFRQMVRDWRAEGHSYYNALPVR